MSINVTGGFMEPKDLVKVWEAPDNSQLTPKQISIRLPLHVAAKIAALSELYPRRSKTELIGDLLATALDQVGQGFSSEPSNPEYSDHSPWDTFYQLWQRHLKELEMEAGVTQPDLIDQKPLEQKEKKAKSKKKVK
jgi:hypothetical protein